MEFSIRSGVADSFFGKSQEPIRLMMEKDIEACEANSMIPKVFKSVDSKNFAEKFTSKTALGTFKDVGEGGAYPQSSMQEGFDKVIEPYEWKNSFTITQTMVEDNKILDINQNALGFTQAYARTKEMFAAALLSNGMNASANFEGKIYSTLCADKKPLFSKEHPSVTNTKYKQGNIFTEGVGSIEEAQDAIGKVAVKMSNFCDDDGNPLNVSPDTIIIPNDYVAIKSVFGAIGADKDPTLQAGNGFNFMFGKWNVIVSSYLNQMVTEKNPHPFILLDSVYNEKNGGAVWVDRIPLSVTSYIDNNNDNNVFNGRTRFSAGFNNWRAFALGGCADGEAA